MTWIDDRLAEKKALEERELTIFSGATKLHSDLLNEVTKQLEEAKRKHFNRLTSQGGEFRLPVAPTDKQRIAQPRALALQLKKDHTAIVANIAGGDITLPLDTEGGKVIMKFDGKTVSIEQAATLVVDRFLFPELKRLDVNSLTAWKGL